MVTEKLRGTVCNFSSQKGYGFIETDEVGDVFIHFSNIVMDGYRTLREGDHVLFRLQPSEKKPGQVEAVDVVRL